jgi:hypothetical protein
VYLARLHDVFLGHRREIVAQRDDRERGVNDC